MTDYNAADLRKIRAAKRAARQAEAARREVILRIMSSPDGRNYVYDMLERCHIFHTSFSFSALAMAFAEGERNVGAQLLNDVMAFAPDQYIQMTREANDRRIADDNRHSRSNSNNGRSDSTSDEPGTVTSDYTPGDEDDGAERPDAIN